jgi:hypothetical protein
LSATLVRYDKLLYRQEVGGSPFAVGGSSTGGLGADADPAIFWKQWAFDQINLGPDGDGRGDWTGKGVTVAVFDTSPYSPGDTAMTRDANVAASVQRCTSTPSP